MTILIGKTLSKAVTWTGVGSIDKSFGLLFGFFKGYVVSVCIFSILNWFYPYKNWGISAENAISFNIIYKGSIILIEEFPSSKDFKDTKDKIEKSKLDKLRESVEFSVSLAMKMPRLLSLLVCMHYNTEVKKDVE